MTAEHALVRIETVETRTVTKYRWVCSCGAAGIPVASLVIPGDEWARGAFHVHATKIDYDSPPAKVFYGR